MRKGLYLRLAGQNIKKNSRFYIPFILATVFTVSIFLILCSMVMSEDLPGGVNMKTFMGIGTVTVAIFCLIFLFYTNSFLIRRRKRELGLYHVLGLEKRHIAKVLFWEMALTAVLGVGVGLLWGVVLNKLAYLVMLNLIHFDLSAPATLEPWALAITALWFLGVFLLLFLTNLFQIRKVEGAQLLRSENLGEKEPKAKWALVVLGILALSAGYFLSIYIRGMQAVVLLFFVAVLLVIIGTYCLFTAGSIAFLKLMKRKKDYYYEPKHFVSVSGMLYRMKQNAVGLATICILSTMVLVLIATTVSLYVGMNDMLKYRFPTDIAITMDAPTPEEEAELKAAVAETAAETGLTPSKGTYYEDLECTFLQHDDNLSLDTSLIGMTNMAYVLFMTPENYTRLTAEPLTLNDGETAVFTQYGELPDTFSVLDADLQAVKRLKISPIGDLTYASGAVYIIVLNDNGFFDSVSNAYANLNEELSPELHWSFDVSGSDGDARRFAAALEGKAVMDKGYLQCRQDNVTGFYQIYGGFLFLGIFLGFLFLMATALIIYYKQISEGYEDRQRFSIMAKVGMDKELIRSSVKSQVLTMFLLPLLAAAIHLAFASPMLTRLLRALNLPNIQLYLICAFCVLCAFAVFYAATYILTAKAYYHIVSPGEKEK